MGQSLKNRHFEMFKAECLYWIHYFGLLDWEVEFSFKSPEQLNEGQPEDARAFCHCHSAQNRLAEIVLCSEWDDIKPTDRAIRMCAFHEVVELLLVRLFLHAASRSSTIDTMDEESHRIIRTLENTVFEEHHNHRFPE